MPRQTRTVAPNVPRIAPTAMKTVPSGRVDCCMKGAFCVGGTAGGGYVGMLLSTVLDRVGRPVNLSVCEGPLVPEMVGIDVKLLGVVVEEPPVAVIEEVLDPPEVDVCRFVVLVVDVGVFLLVDEDVCPPVVCDCVELELFGLFCAATIAEKKDSARKTDSRSDRFSETGCACIAEGGVFLSRRWGRRQESKKWETRGWDISLVAQLQMTRRAFRRGTDARAGNWADGKLPTRGCTTAIDSVRDKERLGSKRRDVRREKDKKMKRRVGRRWPESTT